MNWLSEAEINRCLLCEDAPCSKACIDRVDPAKRVRALYFGDVYRAMEDLDDKACLRCDQACEKACLLSQYGKAIKIKDLIEQTKQIKEEKKSEGYFDQSDDQDISCDICGVKLENPFLLSSSVVGSNYEMCEKALSLGWAGVSFKTISLFPQHETSPRFTVLKNRVGDFMGFENVEQLSDFALEENMSIITDLKEKFPTKVIIASIMGRNEKEWEYLARKCDEAGADVIELNFSCPNMEDGTLGVTIGKSEEHIERFTKASKRGTRKPVLVKLTPNIQDMAPYAKAAKRGGADGISSINTIHSITSINLETRAPEPSIRGLSSFGGYSGKAVKPISLRFLAEMKLDEDLKDLHYSAMGGIETWKDALEYILMGASSLQITTAIMQYGYRIIEDLTSGIKGYMKERNISSLDEIRNTALENMVVLNELERNTILYPEFKKDTCSGCGRCYISCFDGGHQAIQFDYESRRPKLNASKCVGCHLCKLVCPTGSISTVTKRVTK